MFRGTDPDVMTTYGLAGAEARRLGSGFVGAEHLLLAAAGRSTAVGDLLRAHGVSPQSLEPAIRALAGVPAAVAADRAAAAALGVDLADDVAVALRASAPIHRLLPLGWRSGRRWCETARPPIAGDAEAAYQSALYLALARWHRSLAEHHLVEVLLRWSRGSILVAEAAGTDHGGALVDLAASHPPRWTVRSGHERRARSLALSS